MGNAEHAESGRGVHAAEALVLLRDLRVGSPWTLRLQAS